MISIASALLAVLIACVLPSHRPIAAALVVAKLAELGRPHTEPRAAMALLLALPALSAWSTLRALAWRRAGAPCAAAWVGVALWLQFGDPRPVWPWIWPAALVGAVVVEVWAWWGWRARRGPIGVTQRVAAALTAGDVGGFVVGVVCGWGVRGLAEGVAAVAAVVQLVWLVSAARTRRGARAAEQAPRDGGRAGASAAGAADPRASCGRPRATSEPQRPRPRLPRATRPRS